MNPTIEVLLIGEAADDCLSSGQRAVVIAAVSRAVYLNTEKDELYWIAEQNSPMHRRCLQISTPLPKLTVGSILDVRDRILKMPSWGVLDFSHRMVWKAPILLSEEIISSGKLAEHTLLFYRQFLHGHQPVGLGCLLPAILQNLAHGSSHPEFERENILLSTAWPVVERTISLLLTHDFPSLA